MKQKLYREIHEFRFPLICVVLMSLLSCMFVSLSYTAPYAYNPDPERLAGRNYQVPNVKVLNVTRTNANDNYIPYRQAQFFINRSDPGKDCFICEWGVGFFQRTPLMGAVTAGYFTLLNDRPPVDYLWSINAQDESHTYEKFQIVAHILNALFLIPGFYILSLLFSKKTAVISLLMLVSSSFFLYNAVFSWSKSLVAFFVLTMWLLLLTRKPRYTLYAGLVGGLAYMTHDLAVLYIAASMVLLLTHKRYRDTLIFSSITGLVALPWMISASFIYKKPSSFILYPLSLHGLPQGGQSKQIINEFLHTSPLEIISIRFDTLSYLITPHDLIYAKGETSWWVRLWAVGLFSIPGSLGFGLIVPSILGAMKRIKHIDLWIMSIIPILLAAGIIGWRGSRTIASLHFAQATIVLLTGLGVSYLIGHRRKFWLILAFLVNIAQLVFTVLFSYAFREEAWLNMADLSRLFVMAAIVVFTGICMFILLFSKSTRHKKSFLGIDFL